LTAPGSGGIRSFVAVLLPDGVRERLAATMTALRGLAPGLGWVRPENLHVTLRFLGEIDGAMVAAVREAMGVTGASTPPFVMTVAGLGGFPSARAPRVVWAGVTEGAPALGALQARLERELVARGVPGEPRPFHGHVTLARARDPRAGRRLAAALAGAAMEFGGVRVARLSLLRSELDPRGARYEVLAEAELRADRWSSDVDILDAHA
jgi:2'-5' RNA ligase